MSLPLTQQPFCLLQEAPGHSLALGQTREPDWEALVKLPLLVLVGLTGAGKTTLLSHLSGKPGRLALPNRRQLTDQIILSPLKGTPIESLTRQQRFKATADFKQTHPGGMGEILAALRFRSAAKTAPTLLLFDGLRGRAEVESAAQALPHARFVLLGLDEALRVARLAGRADRFDGLPDQPGADPQERLEKARQIVLTEGKSYGFSDSKAALERCAPDRHLILDSGYLNARDLWSATEDFLQQTSG